MNLSMQDAFNPIDAALKYLLLTGPLVLISILISIFFLDKPIAIQAYLFSTQVLNYHPSPTNPLSGHLFNLLTELSYLLITLFFPIYFFLKISQENNQKNNYKNLKLLKFLDSLGFMSLSMALAFFIKSTLQEFFGRIGPRYADSSALLFLRNKNLYGFHFLQHAGSFPSGHMCVYGAGLMALSLSYPQFKFVFLSLGIVLGLILILLNYHFLSDVIAGSYLGLSLSFALSMSRLKNP